MVLISSGPPPEGDCCSFSFFEISKSKTQL
jgi:hypothetical protein